jgi:septum formation protein
MRLVLASASPRRAELLRAAGFAFETCAADVDESTRPGEPAAAYVRRLAAEKSARAQARVLPQFLPQARHSPQGLSGSIRTVVDSPIVIGADTAVVIDGEVLGKPRDAADAKSMLRKLSGRRHEVMTGVSARQGEIELGRMEVTIVSFAALTDADVEWYLASQEGLDKAGAYAIQGLASRFIPKIEGSYSNVVGLPIALVCELLGELASLASGG